MQQKPTATYLHVRIRVGIYCQTAEANAIHCYASQRNELPGIKPQKPQSHKSTKTPKLQKPQSHKHSKMKKLTRIENPVNNLQYETLLGLNPTSSNRSPAKLYPAPLKHAQGYGATHASPPTAHSCKPTAQLTEDFVTNWRPKSSTSI